MPELGSEVSGVMESLISEVVDGAAGSLEASLDTTRPGLVLSRPELAAILRTDPLYAPLLPPRRPAPTAAGGGGGGGGGRGGGPRGAGGGGRRGGGVSAEEMEAYFIVEHLRVDDALLLPQAAAVPGGGSGAAAAGGHQAGGGGGGALGASPLAGFAAGAAPVVSMDPRQVAQLAGLQYTLGWLVRRVRQRTREALEKGYVTLDSVNLAQADARAPSHHQPAGGAFRSKALASYLQGCVAITPKPGGGVGARAIVGREVAEGMRVALEPTCCRCLEVGLVGIMGARLLLRLQAGCLVHGMIRCTLFEAATGGEAERRAAGLVQHVARVDDLLAHLLPPLQRRYMLGHVPRVIAGLSMAAVGGLTVKIPSGVTSLVRALAAVQQGLHRLDGLSGLDEVVGITKWLSKAREYIGLLLLKGKDLSDYAAKHRFDFSKAEYQALLALEGLGDKPAAPAAAPSRWGR